MKHLAKKRESIRNAFTKLLHFPDPSRHFSISVLLYRNLCNRPFIVQQRCQAKDEQHSNTKCPYITRESSLMFGKEKLWRNIARCSPPVVQMLDDLDRTSNITKNSATTLAE